MRKKLVRFFITLLFPFISLAQTEVNAPTVAINSANIADLTLLKEWQIAYGGFGTATFNYDSSIVALALNDGLIRLLSVPTFEEIVTLEGANIEATELRFSRDETQILLSDFGNNYFVWDIDSEKLVSTYSLGLQDNWSAVDDNFDSIAIGGLGNGLDGVIQIESLGNDSPPRQIDKFDGCCPYPSLSPDGRLLLVAHQNEAYLWDVATGILLYKLNYAASYDLQGFGFSPDNQMIWVNWRALQFATSPVSSKGELVFWNTSDGRISFSLNSAGSHTRMYFSRLGDFVATAGQNDVYADTVWVWDMENRVLLGEAGLPTGGGVATFSPDTDLLVVGGGTSSSVHFWSKNQPSICCLFAIDIGSGTFRSPQFTQDGRFLLTIGNTIRLWGIQGDN